MKSLALIVLILIMGWQVLSHSEPEVELLGAEIELSPVHILPLMPHVDFQDLQQRLGGYSEFSPRDPMLTTVVNDLPLAMRSFLDVIPSSTKEQLLEGLSIEDSGIRLLSAFDDQPLDSKKLDSKRIVETASSGLTIRPLELPHTAKEVTPSSQEKKLQVPKTEIQYSQIHVGNEKSRSFWQTLNSRWNQIPPDIRIKLIPWDRLPPRSQAQLIFYFYSQFTTKYHKPEASEPDVLKLRFSDERVQRIYGDYYPARDDYNIVEYHTLNPKPFDEFMQELRLFLKLLGIEQKVLRPQFNKKNNIGLHVHFSSPNFRNFNMQDFELSYKRLVALRGFAKGDLSTIISPKKLGLDDVDFSFSPKSQHKDLIRLISGTRIEVRYFSDDVESDLRELKAISEMAPSEAMAYLRRELARYTTRKTVLSLFQLDPRKVFQVIPFENFKNLNLREEDFVEISKATLGVDETFLLRDQVFAALNQGASLSEVQLRLVETVFSKYEAMLESEILFLKLKGVVFRHGLAHLNWPSQNKKDIRAPLTQSLEENLISYEKKVSSAIEDMKEFRRGQLSDYVSAHSLHVFSLIKYFPGTPWIVDLVSDFLKSHRNLFDRTYSHDEIFTFLIKNHKEYSPTNFAQLTEALLGSKQRALRSNSFTQMTWSDKDVIATRLGFGKCQRLFIQR